MAAIPSSISPHTVPEDAAEKSKPNKRKRKQAKSSIQRYKETNDTPFDDTNNDWNLYDIEQYKDEGEGQNSQSDAAGKTIDEWQQNSGDYAAHPDLIESDINNEPLDRESSDKIYATSTSSTGEGTSCDTGGQKDSSGSKQSDLQDGGPSYYNEKNLQNNSRKSCGFTMVERKAHPTDSNHYEYAVKKRRRNARNIEDEDGNSVVRSVVPTELGPVAVTVENLNDESGAEGNGKKKPKKRYRKEEHICEICGKVLSKIWTLKDHMRTHTGETPFECKECGQKFQRRDAFRKHMWKHSGQESRFKCEVCNKTFHNHSHYAEHVNYHTRDRLYRCDYCSHATTDRSAIKRHIRIHTGERPYKCKFCGKDFMQSGHLKAHERSHTEERPFKCHLCGMAYNYHNLLRRHLRRHVLADAKLTPRDVNKALREKAKTDLEDSKGKGKTPDKKDADLKETELSSETSVSESSSLGQDSETRQNMEQVLSEESVTNDPKKSAKLLKAQNDIGRKSGKGTAKPNAQASDVKVADEGSARKSDLKDAKDSKPENSGDVRLHDITTPQEERPTGSSDKTGESELDGIQSSGESENAESDDQAKSPPGTQSETDAPFPSNSTDQDESMASQASGSGQTSSEAQSEDGKKYLPVPLLSEIPYKCEYCGKVFADSFYLKDHVRIHTGERPYKCDLCPRTFTHSSSLRSHRKKHKGNKPFQCEFCHKWFNTESLLKSHLWTHTREWPFKCQTCHVTFQFQSRLKRHETQVHGFQVIEAAD